jgi:N-acetylglucosaminyldiphosphoundecaprenol N-acetyl-beta-D-mannosaminyltransferase
MLLEPLVEGRTMTHMTRGGEPAIVLPELDRFRVLGVPISAIDMKQALARIDMLIRNPQPDAAAYVCVRDVNGVIACQSDARLQAIHEQAAMVTPDGMPIVWLGQRSGFTNVDRVYGPDLLLEICAVSKARGYRHYFYGGGPGVADLLATRLETRYPGLEVVGTFTPPYRPLNPAEQLSVATAINASDANIVWVGLGSPKQEHWMAEMAHLLPGRLLIGVGAAFDFHAGLKRQAPRYIQRSGMEWAFRLATEPRRLWRRYLFNNTQFLSMLLHEQLRGVWRRSRRRRSAPSRSTS